MATSKRRGNIFCLRFYEVGICGNSKRRGNTFFLRFYEGGATLSAEAIHFSFACMREVLGQLFTNREIFTVNLLPAQRQYFFLSSFYKREEPPSHIQRLDPPQQ